MIYIYICIAKVRMLSGFVSFGPRRERLGERLGDLSSRRPGRRCRRRAWKPTRPGALGGPRLGRALGALWALEALKRGLKG